MDFFLHRNFAEVELLAADWNALLAESVVHVPFLRHEYLRTWWETRGGGEWPESELAIVVALQDGRLVGIAPLFSAHSRDGLPSLLLLGSIEISDYLDLIVRPEHLSAFVSGLFDFLSHPSTGLPAWHSLDWYNLLETSATIPVLKAEAQKRGWAFLQENAYHAPSIPLLDDFEIYLSNIDKKQRHEIRRKMRRARESGDNIHWYMVTDTASLDDEVDAFLSLMAEEPHKAKFLTQLMRQQMHLSCRAAFEHGWLQLAFLEVNGQKAAGYLNFDYLNRIWVYNSGIDQKFMELSPGWVLLVYLLQWATENKRSEFDFMRGNEQYKYRFGGVDKYVLRVNVSR
jgi:CelD/BcsL family acetyltransferase involved in cellulose biosynthesis